MHDLANSERHIGDEIGAREHIQDRKLRDIIAWANNWGAAGPPQAPFSLTSCQR